MKRKKSVLRIFLCILCLIFLLAACTEEPSSTSAEKIVGKRDTAKKQIEIVVGGDLMCQRRQQKAALRDGKFDFRYQFDYVRNIVRQADLAIGNLETSVASSWPLSIEQKRRYGQPYLNAPEEYLSAVKDCGFDVLANANNHSCDTGISGLRQTLKKQDQYGLLHTGAFSGEEKDRFLIVDVKGFKIGIVSYAVYYNRSVRELSGKEVERHLNYYSREKAEEDFLRMREEGAEFILSYFHCGREYQLEPTERQVQIAEEMAESGADYVVGGHSHTVSSFDRIETSDGREVPVAYSLGNFVSHMTYRERKSDHAMILSLKLKREDGRVVVSDQKYYPCLMVNRNEETGRRYQLIPLTDENIEKFTDTDRALVERMKRVRKTIIGAAGPQCHPVTTETEGVLENAKQF